MGLQPDQAPDRPSLRLEAAFVLVAFPGGIRPAQAVGILPSEPRASVEQAWGTSEQSEPLPPAAAVGSRRPRWERQRPDFSEDSNLAICSRRERRK